MNTAPVNETSDRAASPAPISRPASKGVRAARMPGLPLLGNLREFRSDRIGFAHRVARTGDAVEARMGLFSVLMLSSPALAHEVLVEKAEWLVKSAGLSIFLRPVLGEGLLSSERGVHKRQRRMLAPMFAHKRIAGYADTMAARAEKAATSLIAAKDADLAEAMMRLTLEIVGDTLFGVDLASEADRVGPALTDVMESMMNGLLRVVPIPPPVPTRNNRRMLRAVRQLDELVYGMIGERRAAGTHGANADADTPASNDLLGMLLETRDADDGSLLTDREVRDQAMTLMLAGHETTANALAWTLYLLGRHPEARERVQTEIDAVLGGRTPTAADLSKLPLTLQAFKESMRLYPPAYVVSRRATRPLEIGGVHVPRNRVVIVNIAGMHRRPDLFANPNDFDLDRFTPEREKALPPQAYMPFGAGGRICIGNHFALMEGHIVLATLLQRLKIDLASTAEPAPEPLVTLRPKGGVPAHISSR